MKSGERLRGPQRQHHADDSAAERQQHAFEQHLALQSCPRRSEGETDGHFALARCGLRKEKVGHIRARDGENQQHDHRERREKENNRALDCPGGRDPAFSKMEAVSLSVAGICSRVAIGESVEFRIHLGSRNSAVTHGQPLRANGTRANLSEANWAPIDTSPERHPELRVENLVDAVKC